MAGSTTESSQLREFLGRIRPHLPLRESADILMELETAVLDRADDLARTAGRDPTEEDVRRAIEEIGSPADVAASYSEPRHVVDPAAFWPFVLRTGMLFVVHMVLIGIVTALGRPFHVGLFPIEPVGPNGLVSVLAAALHAALLDIGVMTVAFAVAGAFRRQAAHGPSSYAVEAAPRQAGGRAALAILFAIALNAPHGSLFIVVHDGVSHPLFTGWTAEILPLLTALLVVSAAKDLTYLLAGERRLTVAFDALHGFAGVVVMLYLLGGDALLEVPPLEGLQPFLEPLNRFLAQLGTLVLAVTAMLFGAKTLRRAVRFAQL